MLEITRNVRKAEAIHTEALRGLQTSNFRLQTSEIRLFLYPVLGSDLKMDERVSHIYSLCPKLFYYTLIFLI